MTSCHCLRQALHVAYSTSILGALPLFLQLNYSTFLLLPLLNCWYYFPGHCIIIGSEIRQQTKKENTHEYHFSSFSWICHLGYFLWYPNHFMFEQTCFLAYIKIISFNYCFPFSRKNKIHPPFLLFLSEELNLFITKRSRRKRKIKDKSIHKKIKSESGNHRRKRKCVSLHTLSWSFRDAIFIIIFFFGFLEVDIWWNVFLLSYFLSFLLFLNMRYGYY